MLDSEIQNQKVITSGLVLIPLDFFDHCKKATKKIELWEFTFNFCKIPES